MLSKLGVVAVAVAALAAALGAPAAVAAPFRPEVAVVGIHGDLTGALARATSGAIESADRPRFLVVEIAASGKDVGAAAHVAEALRRLPRETETVAYVRGPTTGAAVLVALSCDHLALAPGASLGDCRPVADASLAAELAKLGRVRGYPPALVSALAEDRGGVYRARIEGEGGFAVEEFLPGAALSGGNDDRGRRIVEREEVVPPGALLTLTSASAKRFGIARWLPANTAELVTELENRARGPLMVRTIGRGAAGMGVEGLLGWLHARGLLPLFLFVGILGMLLEVWHPGLVFPGIIGIAALAVALSGGHMAGLTSALEVGLIVSGIVLVLLEMFVFPGFGAAGAGGLVCLLAGGFLAFQASSWPTTPAEAAAWRSGAVVFLAGIVGTIAAFAAAAKLLPRSAVFARLVHTGSQPTADGYTVASAARVALLGRVGCATTDLRPAGKVAIASEELDVVSDGGWIERGATVEVVETSENRIIVKKLQV